MTTIFAGLNCHCGTVSHYQGAAYYVSCRRDDGRHALLAGPYAEHSDALAHLPLVNRLAQDSGDPRACWYRYGTLAVLAGKTPTGVLNDALAASLHAAPAPKTRATRRTKAKRVTAYTHGGQP